MNSVFFYNISSFGYVASLGIFAVHFIKTKNLVLKVGLVTVAGSFLLQTAGMLVRWVEAGIFEVDSTEKAMGVKLTGFSWWVVFTQHPPWSNLHEIMIYMSWGVILATLAVELIWKMPFVRNTGVILSLMALGLASLTDSTISPLVPALKSWWIMIHVISASVAYAAGFLAAFICFLALLKDEKRLQKKRLTAGFFWVMGILIFCLSGGFNFLNNFSYQAKLLGYAGSKISFLTNVTSGTSKPFLVSYPLAHWFLLTVILLHFVGGGVALLRKKIMVGAALVNLLALTMLVVFFIGYDTLKLNFEMDPQVARHLSLPGPYFVSFMSHSWSFGLLILTLLLELFFVAVLLFPQIFLAKIPQVMDLEHVAHKIISLSFFLMTIVLITGALWAHYAWGRYWAWDPKETGALAIWLNYAIYLHTRRTAGLSGPVSSMIGVLGFFVIIVGFLGVNLGLFADGLHSYGNG